jgi:sec-independent protein translocase protein TatA
MLALGQMEIVVILVIALLLFGTRLPKVARSMGQGVSEFKRGLKGVKDEIDHATDTSDSDPDSSKPKETRTQNS